MTSDLAGDERVQRAHTDVPDEQPSLDPELIRALKDSARRARSRARARGLEVDEDIVEQVFERFRSNGGLCEVTGLPFDLRKVGTGAAKRPRAPSVDRKDGERGYTRDNIQVVWAHANFAMNRFGYEGTLELARGMVAYEDARRAQLAEEAELEAAAKPTESPPTDQQLKRDYIDFVIETAPRILSGHGGRMQKGPLQRILEELYDRPRPVSLWNAYGWAFRTLFERGITLPATGSDYYKLADGLDDRVRS
ncbi:MAG: hypothetical protein RIC87_02735 [Kiloniellales bacterium]